jgi:hypothetical protein
VVPSGTQTALQTSFWLAKSARHDYQQRSGDVKLEFKLAAAGRAG